MAAELGVGYISILPEVSKISPNIAAALKGAEPAAGKSGRSMGGKLVAGLGGAVATGAVAVGVSAGAAISGGLTKGIGRLKAIEDAQAKLKGLGHDTQAVSKIMDSALASVKGTSAGLEEAATVSATIVAAGIEPGQRLEEVLKTVNDTATIAGKSMADTGLIFASVAARGKLQGDDMLQLMSAGVPVLQLLSKELGKTSAEVSKMVSDGKIDFETFERAMRQGVQGAALESGKTVTGAFKNMMAASGRAGATIAGPFYKQTAGTFTAVTGLIDKFDARMKPVMADFEVWLTGRGVPALVSFGKSVKQNLGDFAQKPEIQTLAQTTATAFIALVDAGKNVVPTVQSIGSSIAHASASLGVGAWQIFSATLSIAAAGLQAINGPLESVAHLMQAHPTLVLAAVAAYAHFRTIPALFSPATAAMAKNRESAASLGATINDIKAYYRGTGREISTFGAAVQAASTSQNSTLSAMARAYNNATVEGGRFSTAQGTVAAGMKGIQGAASGVVSALGGPWMIALTAAAFVTTQAISGIQEMDVAIAEAGGQAKRNSENIGSFFDAILQGTSKIDVAEQAIDKMTESLKKQVENGPNAVTKMLYNGFATSGDHGFEAWERRVEQSYEISKSAAAAQKALENLGLTNSEVAAAVVGSAGEYDRLRQSIINSGEGGEQLAAQMDNVRSSFTAAQETFDRVGPSAAQAANLIEEIGDKSGDTASKADKLRLAFAELMGINISAEQAAAELTKVLDAQNSKLEQFAGATTTAAGGIDVTAKSGAELHAALNDVASAMQRSVSSGENANQVFQRSSEQLEAMRVAAGIGVEEWGQLLYQMGLTPERLVTVAEVQADPAKAELAQVQAAFNDFTGAPLEKHLIVKDDDARHRLEEFGFKIETINEQTGEVKLTMSDQQALDQYNWWIEHGMPNLGDAKATAQLFMDATPLEGSAAHAQAIIDALAIEKPSPQAQLIIDQLLAGKDIAQGQLDQLAAQSPRPVADLNKDLLDQKVGISRDALARLNQLRAAPVIDADNSPAKAKVEQTKSWLNGLKGFATSVFSYIGSFSAQTGDTGVAGFATGGKLPAHRGYRLPTSGPGTSTTDGFLGVNSAGAPIARVDAGEWIINRRSSRDYARELYAINQGTFPKLPGFADGGVVSAAELLRFVRGESVRGVQASRSLEGAPYVWGGVNWGDCSGMISGIARFARGIAPFAARFATMTERAGLAALGFRHGLSPGKNSLEVGWFNGGPWGGHTSATIHGGNSSINLEMGGGRGNGQIGGRAAPARHGQYTDHAWIPLTGAPSFKITSGAEPGDGPDFAGGDVEITSTSVDGIKTSGGSVSWGKAQELYEAAYKALKRPTLFDTGGVLRNNSVAINRSGGHELVLTNLQWAHLSDVARALPEAAAQMAQAARDMTIAFAAQAEDARQTAQREGYNFGGEWLASMEVVQDAEKGLLETRLAISEDAEEITKAEEELAEAREVVAEARREGGQISTAAARKIEDAEITLARARESGKPDRIADAQRRLTRAQEDAAKSLEKSEDKSAKNLKSALEKVSKAEAKLTKAQLDQADAAIKLDAAERAAAASRYKAVEELVTSIGGALTDTAKASSEFFAAMAKMAETAERARQEEGKLRQSQAQNRIASIKANHELRAAEWDVTTARINGMVAVAKAEAELSKARDGRLILGSTSVDALATAIDRFRRTGVLTAENVIASSQATAKEVAAAQAAVDQARAEAAVSEREAAYRQQTAAYAAADASLTQVSAAQMLQLTTQNLTEQTKALYGLSSQNAKGASGYLSGLSGLGGGLAKILAGGATALAGFTTAGPLGAIPGIISAISALPDIFTGGAKVASNWGEMKAAIREMKTLPKLGLLAGGILGVGAAAAGGVASANGFGPDAAVAGAQVGAKIWESTLQSFEGVAQARLDAANNRAEGRKTTLEQDIERRRTELSTSRASADAKYLAEMERLKAEVDVTKIQAEIAKSTSDIELKALNQAAEIAAKKRDNMLEHMLKTNQLLASDKETKQKITIVIPEGDAFSSDQVLQMWKELAIRQEGLDLEIKNMNRPKITAAQWQSSRR